MGTISRLPDDQRKIYLQGDDPPTSPMIRERNIRLDIALLYPKPFFDSVYLLIELTFCNRGALMAGPSADSTTQGASPKVSFTFFPGDFLDPPDDSNLAMNFAPVEGERDVWIQIHLARFARIVIGVKDEATIVDLLEQYDPCRRDTVRRDSRQSHCLRLADGALRGCEPLTEQVERVDGDRRRGEMIRSMVLLVRSHFDIVGSGLDGGVHEGTSDENSRGQRDRVLG
jgi:hypothetical protein